MVIHTDLIFFSLALNIFKSVIAITPKIKLDNPPNLKLSWRLLKKLRNALSTPNCKFANATIKLGTNIPVTKHIAADIKLDFIYSNILSGIF